MDLSCNSDYAVVSSNEATSIICRFSPDMISDVIDDVLVNKYRNYAPQLVNLPKSIDTAMKLSKDGLPDYTNEINQKADELYATIINKLCGFYNLQCNIVDGSNLYAVAYYLYDFLISNFNNHIYNFFTTLINREKKSIYDSLMALDKKKEASAYSRKIYKAANDPQLAMIHANLEDVVVNLLSYDIDLPTYIELSCIPDRRKISYLQSLLIDNGDFYKRAIVSYYNANFAELTSQLKFELQAGCVAPMLAPTT